MSHYADVAEKLRDRILSGKLRPSECLPSERELCRHFGVSRVTIRQALAVLKEEQLLQRRQGSGTYVSPRPQRRIPLLIDYTGSMRNHAHRLRRELLCWEQRPPSADLASRLGIDDGKPVFYAERLDYLDKTPVAWDQVYIPNRFALHLSRADLQRVDFVEIWAKLEKIEIVQCCQSVDAVTSDRTTTRILQMPSKHPLLKTLEIYEGQNNLTVGAFVSYYRPDFITLTSKHRWQAAEN